MINKITVQCPQQFKISLGFECSEETEIFSLSHTRVNSLCIQMTTKH